MASLPSAAAWLANLSSNPSLNPDPNQGFTREERGLFLQFVWGRSRMPQGGPLTRLSQRFVVSDLGRQVLTRTLTRTLTLILALALTRRSGPVSGRQRPS